MSAVLIVGGIPGVVALGEDASRGRSGGAAQPVAGGKAPDLPTDNAWKALESLHPSTEPRDRAARQPTDDGRREFQEEQIEFGCRAADLAEGFYTRLPDHSMIPAAMGMERSFIGPHTST